MAAEATLGKDHIEEKRNAESGRQREKGGTLIGFLAGQYRIYAEDHLKRPDEAIARVKSCFPHWLGKPLRSITDIKVLAWVRANNQKSNETIGSDLNHLSGVLTVAVNFGLLSRHPLQAAERTRSGLRKPSPVNPDLRVRDLTDNERNRLDAALIKRDRRIIKKRNSHNNHKQKRGKERLPDIVGYGDFLHPLVIVALNTGLRRGELLNLTWTDVDLGLGQIKVRSGASKSGKPRVVPLNTQSSSIMRRWKQQRTDSVVFTRNGTKMAHFRRSWAGLMELARIVDFRCHDCRHDFASQLVMSGIDLYTVSQFMGHSSVDTTQRYAHLSPDHLRAAVDVLDSK